MEHTNDIDIDLADLQAQLGPFGEYLGLQFTSATPDRLEAIWSGRPGLHQPYGIVHGGAYCAVVETLASMGGAIWLVTIGRADTKVVGVNNNTDFFRAVTDEGLVSVATPLHRGRSQQVWVVETRTRDGVLVGRGQVRLQNLEPR